MNLQNIAAGVIAAINPQVYCTLKMSVGYDINPAGVQTPNYATYPNIPCQIQPLSTSDLKKLDGLNLQAIMRKVYLNGNWNGIDRNAIKGGDLFIQPDGTTWKVTQALENWPDWTAFACTLQNGD